MRTLALSVFLLYATVSSPYVRSSPTQTSTLWKRRLPSPTLDQRSPSVLQPLYHDLEQYRTASPSGGKRDISLSHLGRGWVAYVETFESFIPVQMAAAVLTNFYISAYNHVQSIRTERVAESYYACQLDNLILEFFSADAPVPWDFVTSFMAAMAEKVSRGFTGKFTHLYVHMPTGRGIRVSLEVIDGIAAM